MNHKYIITSVDLNSFNSQVGTTLLLYIVCTLTVKPCHIELNEYLLKQFSFKIIHGSPIHFTKNITYGL